LDQVRELLQSKGRMAYRALKRRFALDDDYLEDLKSELIKAERVAVDEDGEVLVWNGEGEKGERTKRGNGKSEKKSEPQDSQTPNPELRTSPSAERRQLTVMFCDLVGSTALSARLDPEELREVIRHYQHTSATVIDRFGGHIAQYLGDGLLVYFGYPTAHEDDAQRAVRAGLEIVGAMRGQVTGDGEQGRRHPLQVRIGIHTGVVVIGEMGNSEKHEVLALGETPNIAARIQGQASPDEVLISAATYRLIEGLFECEDRGQPALKGVTTPFTLYHVRSESTAHSRFETAMQKGLTPLVGREEEFALLRRRWEQAKEGEGQVVVLSGEAGIGKSRLVQEMKERVSAEGAIRIEFRCSPFHQNSALYPIIDHLQRLLQFTPDDLPPTKLSKLRQALARYRFPQAETLALFATLLSLPQPDGIPPLTLSPQKQKEKTQEALVSWLVEEAAQQAVCLAWEDLHWLDPSSLEVLTLLLEQVPTRRALVILTHRPDFMPPWRQRAHSTYLTLSRLGRQHVTALVNQVMATVVLSAEVVQQIVSRTDGVPLFVEELTKTVLESVESRGPGGRHDHSATLLGIPATLQDALMARLDRLGVAKAVAQLGATLGREFSYELLQAVSPIDASALQQALQQLVDAELLYQRGMPPQVTYLFKHALIQDTAYQSLLKSTRQQYHSQIAQVLEERFSDTKETQPELLAHHYTEAGLIKQAIPYWHKAGQRAAERSAYVEAVGHLTKGLDLFKALPDTPESAEQELPLQLALSNSLMATKGYAAPEVEKVYGRALELCRQMGEPPQLFSVLVGLWRFYLSRAEHGKALELGKQCLSLAQKMNNSVRLLGSHQAIGISQFTHGELTQARTHLEQALALRDPQKRHFHASRSGQDPGVACLTYSAWTLWALGYPTQALERSAQALALAQELS
ncbi:MAG: AAA family ATPase, partial [Deltaproteobacteria bacterium]|nr:AAA family ATPase [Deltaproteobacteria bacterium]